MNILLLRGLMREQRHWGEFKDLLETKNHHVLCLDLPGLGTNAEMAFPWSIRDAYLEIRKEFLAKKQEGPYVCVAISLGGMIALDWAHHMPSDFQKLIVINTSSANTSAPWQRLRPQAMKKCLEICAEKDLRKREELILKMTTNQAYKDPDIINAWAEIAKTSPYSLEVALRQLTAASRFLAPDKILCPLLVLASEGDKMVSVTCSRRLAKRLKAELRIHPTAGHDIDADDPDWLLQQI